MDDPALFLEFAVCGENYGLAGTGNLEIAVKTIGERSKDIIWRKMGFGLFENPILK